MEHQTVEEKICSDYVDNMSLENMKQFIYEDLLHEAESEDSEMLKCNFAALNCHQKEKILKQFPNFDPEIS